AEAVGERFRKSETDLGAHHGVETHNLQQIGVKEPDKLRAFASYGRGGPRRVAQQSHLAEKISRIELGQDNRTLGVVAEDNVDKAGTDHIHSSSRFVFQEHCFAGFIGASVDNTLENPQFLRVEFAKEWNVKQDFAQRFTAGSQPKDVGPNAIRSHRKAN